MWPLIVSSLIALASPDPLTVPTRVRPTSAAARALLVDAARSPIISQLLHTLESSDQVVYLQFTGVADIPRARTKIVTAAGGLRFLRIDINAAVAPWERPALLAHELQHAVEIAGAPDVRDDDGVRRLFVRIGFQSGDDKYETAAARDVERRVRGELARRK